MSDADTDMNDDSAVDDVISPFDTNAFSEDDDFSCEHQQMPAGFEFLSSEAQGMVAAKVVANEMILKNAEELCELTEHIYTQAMELGLVTDEQKQAYSAQMLELAVSAAKRLQD